MNFEKFSFLFLFWATADGNETRMPAVLDPFIFLPGLPIT